MKEADERINKARFLSQAFDDVFQECLDMRLIEAHGSGCHRPNSSAPVMQKLYVLQVAAIFSYQGLNLSCACQDVFHERGFLNGFFRQLNILEGQRIQEEEIGRRDGARGGDPKIGVNIFGLKSL